MALLQWLTIFKVGVVSFVNFYEFIITPLLAFLLCVYVLQYLYDTKLLCVSGQVIFYPIDFCVEFSDNLSLGC